MKVLIVFTGPYPVGLASTNRTHHLAKGLSLAGIDVEIIITHPTEKGKDIFNKLNSGIYDGVKFQYVSNSTIRADGLLKRKFFDFLFHFNFLFSLINNKFKADSIIVIGPSLDFRICIPFISKILKIYSYIEINEFPFVGSNSFLSKFKRLLFLNVVLPMYDGAIVISDNLKIYISNFLPNENRIIKIPVVTNNNIPIISKTSPVNVPYIFHAGSLFENKDGILGSIEAYAKALVILNRPVKFVITGDLNHSPHSREIDLIIKKYNLKNDILFTGYLPSLEISRYLSHASLAIVNKYNTIQNHYCFATKLVDYIKYEIPIITTEVGESTNYFVDGFNAFVVKPDNLELLVNKIVLAFNNPRLTNSISSNAKLLLKKEFNFIYQGVRLRNFLYSD